MRLLMIGGVVDPILVVVPSSFVCSVAVTRVCVSISVSEFLLVW